MIAAVSCPPIYQIAIENIACKCYLGYIIIEIGTLSKGDMISNISESEQLSKDSRKISRSERLE
jgi:hypothetical protein